MLQGLGARHGRPHSSGLRALGVWSTAAALLLSGLALHNRLELPDGSDANARVVLTGASPHAGSRVEVATTVDVAACPACLLQLQSLGETVAAPQPFPGLTLCGSLVAPQPQRLERTPRRLAPSRGPPSA
jgi:hypothetical protein